MGQDDYQPQSRLGRYFDTRLPLVRFFHNHILSFRVPRNLNYFYTFGGILTLMLMSQILTGLVMAMHYVPDVTLAFASRERFMREGQFGWLFGPWHSVGASFFFIAAYIHMARGIYYGSYKPPREMVWLVGVLIYLVMMATAFFGYVLVWGQMSFSAASVLIGLARTVPLIGDFLATLLLGGDGVGQPTLNRFYVLHYLLPFALLVLVGLHIWAVHHVGQNNPTGQEVRQPQTETVPFSPHAVIKDLFAISIFLLFFAWFLFYMPDYMGHPDNFIAADPLKTSLHIMPEWYFLPFYAMLRAVDFDIGSLPGALVGVLLLISSLVVLLFIPWLDRSPVRSARYRPLYRLFYWLLIADIVLLGWLGSRPLGQEGSQLILILSQIGMVYYFVFFLVIMPFLPRFEKTLPVPLSIEQDVEARAKRGGTLW